MKRILLLMALVAMLLPATAWAWGAAHPDSIWRYNERRRTTHRGHELMIHDALMMLKSKSLLPPGMTDNVFAPLYTSGTPVTTSSWGYYSLLKGTRVADYDIAGGIIPYISSYEHYYLPYLPFLSAPVQDFPGGGWNAKTAFMCYVNGGWQQYKTEEPGAIARFKNATTRNDTIAAFEALGYAIHYLEDGSMPFHMEHPLVALPHPHGCVDDTGDAIIFNERLNFEQEATNRSLPYSVLAFGSDAVVREDIIGGITTMGDRIGYFNHTQNMNDLYHSLAKDANAQVAPLWTYWNNNQNVNWTGIKNSIRPLMKNGEDRIALLMYYVFWKAGYYHGASNPPSVTGGPTVFVRSPGDGNIVLDNSTYTIKADIADGHGISKAEFFANGVMLGAKYSPPWTWDWTPSSTKTTDCKITVKAYGNGGAGDTTSSTISVLKGAQSYYSRLYVGSPISVIDPSNGQTVTFTLYETGVNNNKRFAGINVSGHPSLNYLYDGMASRAWTNSSLFVYNAGTYNDGTSKYAAIMIAPYQYPSLDIITPEPNVSTGSCQVQLAINYSGKNVPWTGPGTVPADPGKLKKITYGSTTSTDEYYWWSLSGTSGSRTLTVTLRDSLNPATTISKSITVNYDQSASSPDFRGPWGDSWKTMTWSLWLDDGRNVALDYDYWDQGVSNHHYTGGFNRRNRSDFIHEIARSIIDFPMKYNVPHDATTIWVADKRAGAMYNYTDGSINAPLFGIITMKEIYNTTAAMLGKDSQGRYRVWTSSNAGRTDAAPILDAVSPTIAITSHSNYSYVNTSTINLSGTASDDYSLSKVEISINGGAYALAAGTTSWSKNGIALNVNQNIIKARATDSYNKKDSVIITVTYDATPAAITIASPAANGTVYCRTVPVSGTASDNGGVSKVEVSINDGPWRMASWANGSTSVWRCDVNLAPGTNGIRARVTDVAGNATIASHVANYSTIGSPPAAPQLSPATVSAYTDHYHIESQAHWSTKVYDLGQNGVYTISARLWITYGTFAFSSMIYSSTYISTSLDQTNWIRIAEGRIRGDGQVGNPNISSGIFYGKYLRVETSIAMINSAQYTYAYGYAGDFVVSNACLSPLADMTNPTVSISSPSAGAMVGSSTLAVTGTASDNVGVWGVQARCNNGAWVTASGTTSWSANLILTTGTNTIEVRAYDATGNMATSTRQVVYSPACLAGYWKLDASTGNIAADASGLENNGTVYGATWTAGQKNNGLSFDGVDDYVNTNWSGTLSNWSVSAWIKDSGSKTGYRAIIQTQDPNAGQNDHALYIYPSSSGNVLSFWPYGGGTVGITPNVWTHVAATYDGSTIRYYVNGEAAGSAAASAGDAFKKIRLGGWGTGDPERFSGLIDEVRVYGKALTADEVQILHMQGCLAGSWKFDETSGSTAGDLSGYGNTGTLMYMDPANDWVTGQYGKALDLDGSNDYVAVPVSTAFNMNQLTICMWIKTPASFGGNYRNLLSKQNASYDRDYNLYAYSSDGVKVTALHLSSTRFGSAQFNLTTAYSASTWHHVAVTVNQNGLHKYYSDGVLLNSYQGTAGNASSSYPIWIGHGDNYWKGLIDEVRIYNKALSASEITAIKNNTKTEEEPANEYSELEIVKPAMPKTMQLISCAPNPFTGQTTISFQLSKPAQTTIRVYNITGQEVRALVNECLRPGYHSVKWDGKSDKGQKVAAGVYLYRMQAGDYSATRKLTILR